MKKVVSTLLASQFLLSFWVIPTQAKVQTASSIMEFSGMNTNQETREFTHTLSTTEPEEVEPDFGSLTYAQIIEPEYDSASRFSEGLVAVRKGGSWGFVDEKNQTVVPFVYSLVNDFSEGLAVVGKTSANGLSMGIVTTTGQYRDLYINSDSGMTPLTGNGFTEFSSKYHNGFVSVYDAQKEIVYLFNQQGYEFSRSDGNTATGPVGLFNEDRFAQVGVNEEGTALMLQFFDKTGALVRSNSHSDLAFVYSLNQGILPAVTLVDDQMRIGMLSYANNSWKIEPQYTDFMVQHSDSVFRVFGETGLAVVQNTDGFWGAVNMDNETVIPFEYQALGIYSEGLISFQKNGKVGYMDHKQQVVIPAAFQKGTAFQGGLAVVQVNNSALIINRKGETVVGSADVLSSAYFESDGAGGSILHEPTELVTIRNAGGKIGFGKIQYIPELPNPSDMSSWAFTPVTEAVQANLLPVKLQNMYEIDISREDFASFVVHALCEILNTDAATLVQTKTGRSLDSYTAVFADTSEIDTIAAYALGIISGTSETKFSPYVGITRQEAAIMLRKIASICGLDTTVKATADVSDLESIEPWALEAVNYMYQEGVMSTVGNNQFGPKNVFTKEQAISTVLDLAELIEKNTQ